MTIDWTKIYKNYKGRWVALSSDEKRVVASATTAKEVREQALRKGHEDAPIMFVPRKVMTFAGIVHEVRI